VSVRLSVCPSVVCLDLIGPKWKGPGSPKLAGWKPIARLSREPLEVKRSKFKLGTQKEHEDPYHRKAPWRLRSKVKVARSRGASDRCRSISREQKVAETPKLCSFEIA